MITTPHDVEPLGADAFNAARRLLHGFALELRQRREHHGFSVRALAEQTGIRPDILNRIENVRWMPSVDEAEVLRHWMLQHPLPTITPNEVPT